MVLDYFDFLNEAEGVLRQFRNNDIVRCKNVIVDGLNLSYHLGIFHEESDGTNYLEFFRRFNSRLHNVGGRLDKLNGWYLSSSDLTYIMERFKHTRRDNSLPLLFSEDFSKKIYHTRLDFLLDFEHNFHSDISYIDFTNSFEYVSYLNISSYLKLKNKDDVWITPLRRKTRIGRFFRKLIPKLTDVQLENLVNEFKFVHGFDVENYKNLKTVTGDDIRYWYLGTRYVVGGGNLNSSCMMYEESQKRMRMYTDNKNRISLLILLDNKNKLLGRALIWKLDFPIGRLYMDRVYVSEDYLEKVFQSYAEKHDIMTYNYVKDNFVRLRVNLKKDYGDPKNSPFMDTFKFFVIKDKYLSNRKPLNLEEKDYREYVDHD